MIAAILGLVSLAVLKTIEYSGYTGIFFLMAIESANIPVPSEIIMPFSGFLVSQGIFNFWAVVFFGALGNLFGSLFSYWLGLKWGRKILPYGKYIFISEHDVEEAGNWFERFGNAAVFLSRVLPVVRTFISFPSGLFRVPLLSFSVYTFTGSFLWSALLTYLGVVTGENWRTLEGYFRKFDIAIIVIILLGMAWWIYRHFKNTKARMQIEEE